MTGTVTFVTTGKGKDGLVHTSPKNKLHLDFLDRRLSKLGTCQKQNVTLSAWLTDPKNCLKKIGLIYNGDQTCSYFKKEKIIQNPDDPCLI